MTDEWVGYMVKSLYRVPGKHALVVGITGSGKTQVLYELLNGLSEFNPKETLVWFDTGKSSEILTLATIKPLLVFIPKGYDLQVDSKLKSRIDVGEFDINHYEDVLNNLDKSRINVISIRPFFRDVEEYVEELNKFLRTLINMCYDYAFLDRGSLPIAIFIDELQHVAPAQGHAFNEEHTKASVNFEYNVDMLRSWDIRVIGGTQNWTRLRRGVRHAFQWLFIKKGARFTHSDFKKLELANPIWAKLAPWECVLFNESGNYSEDKFKFKFYGDGEDYGYVRYLRAPLSQVSQETEICVTR